jgi:septal ring factor EnvC (AmiA/AmiB activator)
MDEHEGGLTNLVKLAPGVIALGTLVFAGIMAYAALVFVNPQQDREIERNGSRIDAVDRRVAQLQETHVQLASDMRLLTEAIARLERNEEKSDRIRERLLDVLESMQTRMSPTAPSRR